mmetsp:Transcript_35171/g.34195  ORF Transcript_35171/g.34195 Transcript_35171/m.34195 type:complete len:305 (+) Transcript_35171:1205-2119(+)
MKVRVFLWIRDNLRSLKDSNQKLYDQFKRELTQNFKVMVSIEAVETVRLIDDEFNSNHKMLIESLFNAHEEKLKYIEAMLNVKEQVIQDTIREYSLQSANPQEAKKYIEFMKMHLRLCCQLKKKEEVLAMIEEKSKQGYQPNEEYLMICLEFKQTEACGLLNKKLGKYYESVQMYLNSITENLNIKKLMYELYEGKKGKLDMEYPIKNEKLRPNATKIDHIVVKVLKICKNHYKEVDIGKEEQIWYDVLEKLYSLKNHELMWYKKFCREFFDQRINMFIVELVNHISFQNFYEQFVLKQKNMKF